jgi:hypothetical protein
MGGTGGGTSYPSSPSTTLLLLFEFDDDDFDLFFQNHPVPLLFSVFGLLPSVVPLLLAVDAEADLGLCLEDFFEADESDVVLGERRNDNKWLDAGDAGAVELDRTGEVDGEGEDTARLCGT